jgi:hypothetical protein
MFVRERWPVVLNPALFAKVKAIFEDLIIVPGFRYRYPDDSFMKLFSSISAQTHSPRRIGWAPSQINGLREK